MSCLDTCGFCPFFRHEDADGLGICDIQKNIMHCSYICPYITGDLVMITHDAERILHYHQRWRRGADAKMVNCKILGLAIDEAIRTLRYTRRKNTLTLTDNKTETCTEH